MQCISLLAVFFLSVLAKMGEKYKTGAPKRKGARAEEESLRPRVPHTSSPDSQQLMPPCLGSVPLLAPLLENENVSEGSTVSVTVGQNAGKQPW